MRSIAQIYAEIVAEKDNNVTLNGLLPAGDTQDDLLSDLSTGSKVAIWRLWAYIMAVAIYVHEALFEQFRAEVEELAAQAPAGTPAWYQAQAFKFQFGDPLVYQSNGQYNYAIIDPTKQVVKRCAVVERPDGTVLIKAAKLDSSGEPTPLSAAELTALEAYFEQIKFAGTRLSVTSFPADDLKVYYDIYYNPLYDLAALRAAVEEAIQSYISSLPFNAEFSNTALTDAIQAVEAVNDPILISTEARYGALPYQAITRTYTANAGYLKIDPAAPLSATLDFIAD